MKRLLLLLITVSLLFTMIPHASADSQMTLSVLNASVLNAAGTEVCVPVLATPGFRYAAGIADIHWDAEVLSLKEVLFDEKAAPDNGSAPITDTGSYRISVGDYRAEKNYIGNGVFFTLIFAVKANAKSGNYAIQIQNAEFYNKDMERLYTETADGFVTISDGGLFSLAVESVSLEKDTKTFQTAVIAEQNPGYAAAVVDIIWNPEMFILQSVTFEESAAPDLATREIENNGCFRVSFGNYEAYQDYKQTGVLFTLQFQLAENAEPGEYIISLANADVVNSSLLPLDTVQSDGIVRIMGDKSDTITTATTSKATMTTTITTTTTSKATTTTTTTTTTSKATTTTAATTTTSKATTTTTTTTASTKETTATETTSVTTSEAEPAVLCGDVNGDGKIGVDDAQTALVAYTEQFAGNPVDLTDIQRKAVDVNRDGLLNVDDAQNILIFYTERNVAGKDIKWEDVISPKPQSLTFFKRLAAGSCMQRALLHGGHPEVRCRLRQ